MKSKNTDQFLNIYNEYAEGVFRFCFFKTSDREIALDITQEVFAKIWEYMKKGGSLENQKAFVYSTASRKVIDWYRTRKNTMSLDSLREVGFDFSEDEKDAGFRIDGEQALQKLDQLEDIYRDVLLLRYVEELSVSEIAKALDETENNVSVRIHRGMERLRNIYNDEEKRIEEKTKESKLSK